MNGPVSLEGFPIYLNALPTKEWLESVTLQRDVANFLSREGWAVSHEVLLDDYSVKAVHPEAAEAYLAAYAAAGLEYRLTYESELISRTLECFGDVYTKKDTGKVLCAAIDAIYQREKAGHISTLLLLHPKTFIKQQESMHEIYRALPVRDNNLITQFVTYEYRFSKTLITRK